MKTLLIYSMGFDPAAQSDRTVSKAMTSKILCEELIIIEPEAVDSSRKPLKNYYKQMESKARDINEAIGVTGLL